MNFAENQKWHTSMVGRRSDQKWVGAPMREEEWKP